MNGRVMKIKGWESRESKLAVTADCLEDVEEKIADTRLRKAVDSGLSMSDHNARSSGGAETSVTIFVFVVTTTCSTCGPYWALVHQPFNAGQRAKNSTEFSQEISDSLLLARMVLHPSFLN